jgi:hypothetical protein
MMPNPLPLFGVVSYKWKSPDSRLWRNWQTR